MARWTDLAQWVGPTVNEGDGDGKPGEQEDHLLEHRGVVIHIADGTYLGTIAWQRNPAADVSSTFICAKDGRRAQMVDTDDRAWTQRAGNSRWHSIEFEGYTGQSLTAQQVEFAAQVLAREHREYGVPLQVATSPSGRGLGHHSMGAESGVDWGHSECPGPAIKAQKPQIVARAIEIINGGDDVSWTENLTNAGGKSAPAGRILTDTADRVWLLGQRLDATDAVLKSIAAKVDIDPEEIAAIAAAVPQADSAGIARLVLAGLDPAAIATAVVAAMPADQARRVADELAARLQS
jgi:hypothetical protein